MQKHVKQFFLILRLLTYIEKKLGHICQSYDVIKFFSKWEATIPIRLFDKASFSIIKI
jgi:hypothetical protein